MTDSVQEELNFGRKKGASSYLLSTIETLHTLQSTISGTVNGSRLVAYHPFPGLLSKKQKRKTWTYEFQKEDSSSRKAAIMQHNKRCSAVRNLERLFQSKRCAKVAKDVKS